jgi:hypothetical protein
MATRKVRRYSLVVVNLVLPLAAAFAHLHSWRHMLRPGMATGRAGPLDVVVTGPFCFRQVWTVREEPLDVQRCLPGRLAGLPASSPRPTPADGLEHVDPEVVRAQSLRPERPLPARPPGPRCREQAPARSRPQRLRASDASPRPPDRRQPATCGHALLLEIETFRRDQAPASTARSTVTRWRRHRSVGAGRSRP